MKHLILLLYFMSFTSGIGAITLLEFYYKKTKTLIIKYIILADVFFTLYLFFDTFNFYTAIVVGLFPPWLQMTKIAWLAISSIGLIYFFVIFTYLVTTMKLLKQKKVYFLTISIIFYAISFSVLYILYHKNLISSLVALHSGFFVTNIFSALGCAYNLLLIFTNWGKIQKQVKKFILILVVLIGVIIPLSILSNIAQYWILFNTPIAFSPFSK